MKVKELIEFLNTVDPELECLVRDMEWGTGNLSKPRIETNITVMRSFFSKDDVVYEEALVF